MAYDAYIIVEGRTDQQFVRVLLPEKFRNNVNVVASGGKSAAISLCRSILVTRQKPTVLVVDSNTTDEREINEQHIILNDLLLQVAGNAPYLIEFAVPAIESVLFCDAAALESILRVKMNDGEKVEARYNPKVVLADMLRKAGIEGESEFLSNLGKEAAAKLSSCPLIADITRFLGEKLQSSTPMRNSGFKRVILLEEKLG
jgi:hypothetical protein